MKNKNIFFVFGILAIVFTMSSFLAETQFYQSMQDMGNGTIRNRLSLLYTKNGLISDDYVMANSPFETYIQYSFNVRSHNLQNPNFTVDYCNLKIWVWKHLETNQTLVYEKNFSSADADLIDAQYFFRLYDRDWAIAQQECHFANQGFRQLEIPANMQIVLPTLECKSCQFYLWSKQEATISKTVFIGNNVVSVSGYIQKLIVLNFEIIVVLFWIALILLLFIAVGLIFMGIYWLFLYLNRMVK